MKKAWWRSRMVWLNVIAGVALLVQSQLGFVLDPEAQAGLLALANLILRIITKEAVGLQDQMAGGDARPTGPGPFPGIDAGGPGVQGQ